MSSKLIDLRSDTVTRPTPGMYAAMMNAPLGDDVFGDDPSVNRLQDRVAEMTGKEAALFVSSGTQGNQICIRVHTRSGDEVVCDGESHIVQYEAGGLATLSGLSVRPVAGKLGVFTAEQVERALRPDNIHFPPTKLVVIENTHNRGGGSIWPIRTVNEVCDLAHSRKLSTHLDGARIFNAAVATGIPLRDWCKPFDTLSVCFSKGLGAPVGSVIAGPRDFIKTAKRIRKMFGGGWRQAGILAAAAEYALDHHVERLAEDHTNAKLLADGLGAIEDFAVDADLPTNMVFWNLCNPELNPDDIQARCKARGVLFNHIGNRRFRAVTHLDVSTAAVKRAVEVIQEEMAGVPV